MAERNLFIIVIVD